jgi:hypothetical protein
MFMKTGKLDFGLEIPLAVRPTVRSELISSSSKHSRRTP